MFEEIIKRIDTLNNKASRGETITNAELILFLVGEDGIKKQVEEMEEKFEKKERLFAFFLEENDNLKLKLGHRPITMCCGAEAKKAGVCDSRYWYCPKCFKGETEDPKECEIEWKKDECEHKWVYPVNPGPIFIPKDKKIKIPPDTKVVIRRKNTEECMDEDEVTSILTCEKCRKTKTEVWTEYSLV